MNTPPYVIELQTSPFPIDPKNVPSLEIFNLYTLYCDVRPENGVVRHALRLGFFKDSATARTIARYLESYFDSPEVIELSGTGVRRSTQLRLVPLKDVGDSGRHSVIELSTPAPPPVHRLPSGSAAAAASSSAHDAPSLWTWIHKPVRSRGQP
jgi:hypothetical protein